MSKQINVVVIGFGFGHQLDYGRELAEHGDTKLVGVGERPGFMDEIAIQKGRDFAAKYGVEYYADYREMLKVVNAQAASVAVEPEFNVEIARNLARHGISMMCEKPIGDSLKQVDELGKVLEETGVKFTFDAPMTIFSNSFRPAIEQVQAGAIGEARVGYFQYLASNGPEYVLSPERCRQVTRAELANFGPYGILAFLKMFNAPIKSVFARKQAAFYEQYRENNLDDLSLLSLKFEGGGIGTMLIGRTTTKGLPSTDLRMQVIGSQGVVNIEDGLGYGMELYVDNAHRRLRFGASVGKLFVDDFVSAVRDDRQPMITFQDARTVMAFLDAAYESADSGQEVSLKVF
ncbi:MAG: Gfo/Idh/MocA family oxidoreductase [Candidatus Pacebacteria bacterium]|nr:Gfo/Idh/MocA family oxidoreductase [Candidatus Paceibacterota bacterium]